MNQTDSTLIQTNTPEPGVTIEIYESADYVTVIYNGKYADSFSTDNMAAREYARMFVKGMAKMLEMQRRARDEKNAAARRPRR